MKQEIQPGMFVAQFTVDASHYYIGLQANNLEEARIEALDYIQRERFQYDVTRDDWRPRRVEDQYTSCKDELIVIKIDEMFYMSAEDLASYFQNRRKEHLERLAQDELHRKIEEEKKELVRLLGKYGMPKELSK